jgi:hypothetical protein
MPKAVADIRSLARSHTRLCITTLAGIARNGTSEPARVSASVALLERGWGKPQQDVAIAGDIRITIRKMLDDDEDVLDLVDVTPKPKKLAGE